MKITPIKVSVRDLVTGYRDSKDCGVVAWGGKLDVRPPFQREFIYKEKQRNAVINTVLKDFPLNTIYFSVKHNDDGSESYEVLDGQQRIISICQYATNLYSVNWKGNQRYYHNLESTKELMDTFDNYKLDVYLCDGSNEEKLEWFETINIAGMVLKDQELRNAMYVGPWLADAKAHFSKVSGPAHYGYKEYLKGDPDRQDYLETVIKWAVNYANSNQKGSNEEITGYMAAHQNDPDAKPLWEYFLQVMKWVKQTFPNYRKEMDGLDWGFYYNNYAEAITSKQSSEFETKIATLMEDDEVTKNRASISTFFLVMSGIYLSAHSP